MDTWISMRAVTRVLRVCALAMLGLMPVACQTLGSVEDTLVSGSPAEGAPGHVEGFLGGVVADEPRAAVAAREVLSAGGSAADAAVAAGFMLAVTLPSRAGLGAGGICLAYAPSRNAVNGGVPEAVVFDSLAGGGGGDRPASVPMLARGLFALHARYGRRPFETLIAPAEQAARFGVPASRAFVRDLATVAGPLFADPTARALYADASGAPIAEGAPLIQPELGGTLAQLRVAGVGDLYMGQLSRRLADASAHIGGGVTVQAARAALPQLMPVLDGRLGRDRLALPPGSGKGDRGEGGRALLAALAGQSGETTALRPASAGFATLDRDGDAVACAVSMNNLFGIGRIAPGTGMLLAAAPGTGPAPLLAPAIAWNDHLHAFRAAVVGTGQGAAAAAAVAALRALLGGAPASARTIAATVAEPGRADAIACGRYLPDADASCGWTVDPRGAGLAAGSN